VGKRDKYAIYDDDLLVWVKIIIGNDSRYESCPADGAYERQQASQRSSQRRLGSLFEKRFVTGTKSVTDNNLYPIVHRNQEMVTCTYTRSQKRGAIKISVKAPHRIDPVGFIVRIN
jgi:hypothetical protein